MCVLAPMAARAGECFPVWGNVTSIRVGNLLNTARLAADFDGDGKTDVAIATRTEVFVAMMGANGQLTPLVKVGSGENLLDLRAADVNGDRKADLIANDTVQNAIVVFPGLGNGSFGPSIHSSVSVTPSGIVTGDFNGDGRVDVAFNSDSGFVGILLGDNTGMFQAAAGHLPAIMLRLLTAGDFDGDGKLDLLARTATGELLRLFRGHGNGTVSTPAAVDAGWATALAITAGDVDGDGDLDVVTGTHIHISVLLNQGGGTFAAPVDYPTAGSVHGRVALFDVTRDRIPDAVVQQGSEGTVATYPGKGDGTYGPVIQSAPTLIPPGWTEPQLVRAMWGSAADTDGDGATDDLLVLVSLSAGIYLGSLTNQCGAVKITPTFTPPLISVGQESRLSVTIGQPGVTVGTAPAKPTGEVKLYEGATLLRSATLADGTATFTLPGSRGAGTHALRVVYPGDAHYDADEADAPFRVTSVTSSIVTSVEETTVAHPRSFQFVATVTASDGSVPSNSMLGVYVDGVFRTRISSIYGGEMRSSLWTMAPGDYTLQFHYEGTSEHPPSPLSDPIRVTVVKGESDVRIHHVPEAFRVGEPGSVTVASRGIGEVSLYDGTRLIGSMTTSGNGWAVFETVTFDRTGVHTLIARRHENENYHGSEASEEVRVFVAGPAAIEVVSAGEAIQVWWVAPDNTEPQLERLTGGVWTPWLLDDNPTTIATPTPGVPYIFRLRVYEYPDTLVATSNVDGAMMMLFTDEPLTAGARIKAVHFTQLLAGVNAWRGATGLPALSIPNLASGNVIRAADLTALRNGLNQARSTAAMPPFAFQALTAKQTKIKAADVLQLRDFLR